MEILIYISKKLKIFLFILFYICLFETAFSQWTFQYQNSNTTNSLLKIKYINSGVGFAVGINGVVIKTINAGKNWNTLTENFFPSVWDFHVFNEDSIIVVGAAGMIFKSTNGGINWYSVVNPYEGNLYSVVFSNLGNGVATSDSGVVLHSLDYGENWNIKNTGAPFNLLSSSFPTEDIAFAAGYGGLVKSTDGGESWSEIYNCIGKGCYNFYKIQFFNSTTGFITRSFNNGGPTSLLKTTNGGANFVSLTSSIPRNTIMFNSNVGFGNFLNNSIRKVFNSGTNWTSQEIFNLSGLTFTDLYIHDTNNITVVGANGVIIKLEYKTSHINFIANEFANEFILHQNYPNPFNPVTNIKFTIPLESKVRLYIYDALGKVVEEIINENLLAGVYEIQFDASKLSSGVYFYKLEAENFNDVKKMMVLK